MTELQFLLIITMRRSIKHSILQLFWRFDLAKIFPWPWKSFLLIYFDLIVCHIDFFIPVFLLFLLQTCYVMCKLFGWAFFFSPLVVNLCQIGSKFYHLDGRSFYPERKLVNNVESLSPSFTSISSLQYIYGQILHSLHFIL